MNDGILFSINNKNALRIIQIFGLRNYLYFFPVWSLIKNRGQKMISLVVAIIFLKHFKFCRTYCRKYFHVMKT